ncbi:hypothetical protein HZA86_01195 [Candidatus Uhrbacteria bacterium]|nr:hypothetical protein [Candidatus Uhrbacteria bacterium]
MGEHRGLYQQPKATESESALRQTVRDRFNHQYQIERRRGNVVIISKESHQEYTPERFIALLEGVTAQDRRAKKSSPAYSSEDDPRTLTARGVDDPNTEFFARADREMVEFAKERLAEEGVPVDLLKAA